jgi:hypothetical protein
MWPFSTRSSRLSTRVSEPTDFPKFEEFAKSDANIKVWLPLNLDARLDWLSLKLGCSKPDIARAMVFEHLYGRLAYNALLFHCAKAQASAVVTEATEAASVRGGLDSTLHRWASAGADGDDARFSRRRSTTVDLEHIGKSDWDFTFAMPQRLLTDLKEVAAIHSITPSHYIRKMLVLHLLGEKIHSRWQQALGKISPDVAELER